MVALAVTCIYLLLAGVHVYWALGGRLGKHAAVPRPAAQGQRRRDGASGAGHGARLHAHA
ncbi:hypothetical protein [Cupriavidus sp. CuC1]|uniref:hypothetical protein n=1 Tax=Cupriavidus sp. CuC1 TaxID=3373131 RepID=UPI0037D31EAF